MRGGSGGGRGGNREMDRPWVTPALRQEMLKTKVSLLLIIFIKKILSQSLASVARKAKSAEAVAALGDQQERTEALLEEAKVDWPKVSLMENAAELKTNNLQLPPCMDIMMKNAAESKF